MTAAKLKNFFGADLVRSIAADFAGVDRTFDAGGFVERALAGLDQLELVGRGRHVAEALHKSLPARFADAAELLIASLGPELSGSGEIGLEPLRYMPHVFFVQKYGIDDFEPAMRAQYELTKRFSAEFSIRAFLEKYPEAAYARLRGWTRDENLHVRRLVSEGTRPRLPWAPRLRAFQKDPSPVIALLELLKDDPESYVQRSIANNLNDIGKDHPDLVVDICRRWSCDAPAGRAWITRHALRSLVKKSHRGALEILGFGSKPEVAITKIRIAQRRIGLGEDVRFSFQLTSTGDGPQELLVDYAVHFVKANGRTHPKVFKLRKILLHPSTRIELRGIVSLKTLTTRRHYPGRHQIEVLINGVSYPMGAFDVVPLIS